MYYNNVDMNQNLQFIYSYLNSQQERINYLETTIHQLQNEIMTLKQNPASNIERVEYKFDQLKVERLEGTLNIGITPQNGGDSIEDFAVAQHQLNVPQNTGQPSNVFENVRSQIHHYLNGECYQVFNNIEQQNNYFLDNHYRQYIVQDILRQIDSRIQYYLNQLNQDTNLNDTEQLEMLTIDKVKEDIHKTYDEFIKHLPQRESDS
ncbi:spore germination protein GerPC [Halalkalibacter akibai]|uniref:Spore germination protein n=1 Tax=Halalkalibacter akibai (strain ATCC 43226 / DSM 21942 / CIP 109018 / JCM 9157 / 1139) TaxID=1236973 RepID=W4QVW7_HALA3|nr:spore germination protein GerPC [Halalkalibacter akibai]GAE35444.1 spore germination protein [Halalkalibacter akibai JCM 9157]